MKKLLSMLLCVTMILCMMAGFASAAESEEIVIDAREFSSIVEGDGDHWNTGDGNLGIHVNTVVTYKFNVEQAGTYKLSLNYVYEYRVAKFDVSVNGVKVIDSTKTSFPQQKLAYQDLCVVELQAGENTIELTNIGTDGKALFLNEFTLVPCIAINARNEFTTAGPTTESYWQTGDGNLGVHANAFATYTFNVDVPGTYTLALKYVSQYRAAKFEVKVNGEQVVNSDTTYPQQALAYQTLCDVELKAGENTIEFTNIAIDAKAIFLNEFVLSLVEAAPCEHTNTKVEGAKDATCTEAGHTGNTVCADCGEQIAAGEEIAALGHKFAEGKCSVCGAADPDYVAPCQHEFKDGKCTLCGEADPNYSPETGDMIGIALAMLVASGTALVALKKKEN